MPQVPVYGDRQLRTQALQPVMQQTPDVSSGARALAQGLGQVAEVADRIDLRDAQAKAATAESQITSEWMKWDAENRNKYRGANADGYVPAAEAWWKSAAENAGKELDPRAKSLASQSLRAKQTAALGNVQTFTMAEKERHADETYSADVATTIQFGVTSGDVASTAVQIRDKAAVLGARKGWTTEQVQAEAGKNLSAMHLAQISKLAENNAQAAQAYYDANKAEVGFQNQARVEQVLKGEADNQFATQTAAAMAGKPLSEQLAEAAKITDPQRREKTLNQVRNNYALVKQAEQERENAAADKAWQNFATGQKTPEAILSAMSGRERVQLQEAQRTRSERLAAGKPVKTNPDELARIYDMARENPDQFATLKLVTMTERISGSDLEQIATLQRSITKDKNVVTSAQLVGSYTKDMKADKKGQFEQVFYNRLFEFKEKNSRNPTDKEQKAIIDDLMMRRDNAWYQFSDVKKWQLSDADRANAKFVPGPNASKPPVAQFETGKTYVDKNGNRARYLGNDKWENL
jgi:PIN domain nuclease of toxin-antitoxin system